MSDKPLNKNYTEEQKQFIEHSIKGDSVILSACAGSGKTYSAIERLKFMLEKGVDPSKIIFFSFTVAAVGELKSRVQNDKIKITTIHSFCVSMLGRMKKLKTISTFYDFIDWFKDYHKPKENAPQKDIDKFYSDIENLYDTAEYISSSIAAYKLQTADNIKCKEPDYLQTYLDYQKQVKSMDFSDMLIVVRESLKEDKWLKMFRNQYEFVFIDEFQDCSSIMVSILLSLNAKCYYLMGDRAQAIYGYSGANCDAVEAMLKRRRKTIDMHLTVNFRSATSIIENSNKHSHLQAIPFHKEEGKVHRKLITFEQLIDVLKNNPYVAVLVRTNAVIKEIERRLLILRVSIRYENYLKPAELEDIKQNKERVSTKNKIRDLLQHFESVEKIIEFIELNKENKSHIRTIHRSKGLEYPSCVVVNSISPDVLKENNIIIPKERISLISYDPEELEDLEPKNVHYVSVSRSKSELFFMLMD